MPVEVEEQTKIDKIIDKIGKLLTKAEGTTNELEAQAFQEKAQALMREFAIEEEQILRDNPTAPRNIVTVSVTIPYRDEMKETKWLIYSMLAKATSCRFLIVQNRSSQKETKALIIGHESDVQFVQMLQASVWIQFLNFRGQALKSRGNVSRYLYQKSFAAAYTAALGDRLKKQEVVEESEPGSAVVLFDRKTAVDNFLDETFGKTEKVKGSAVRMYTGAENAGTSAAARTDVTGGRNSIK